MKIYDILIIAIILKCWLSDFKMTYLVGFGDS